ncbi:Hol1p [Sugiyamaella lignohabitans]|uniref:Hol1p n=1 Tax=Sugiyamaella lignohabitans TaxID=796027 RepID=A0A167DW81_9ASCO|nr:Hol1p [Sugiyamaella lignohabitans]ANB13368.1 Hol1p [Sugiyamaella lignohabitans]
MTANFSDEDHLPGTEYIYADPENNIICPDGSRPKTNKDNKILLPQPTESPNDPLNWGLLRKCWHMILVCLVTGFTAATSNDAGATQTDLNANLGISWNSFNTGAGVLFIGIGWFTLILSPTSFLYGRRIGYLICILVGLAGAAWFANIRSTSDAIWSQLFVGASESVAEAQVQLSLVDIFYQHQLPGALALYIVSTSIGTYLGPLIAGYISDNLGWEWVGYSAVIISGFILIVLFFGLEETYFDRNKYQTTHFNAGNVSKSDSIDEQVKNESRLASGDSVMESKNAFNSSTDSTDGASEHVVPVNVHPVSTGADEKPKTYWQRIALITPADNLKGVGFKQYFQRMWLTLRVFTFPPVIYSGLIWGFQDAWLTFYITTEDDDWSSPPYNYGDAGVAIMNVPTLIGALFGCFYAGVLSDYFVEWMARRNHGVKEAEHRLWLMFLVAILNPLGLFIFGIGTAREWSWPVVYILGLFPIGFAWGSCGDLSMSYLAEAYPEMVLEGMVGVSVVNNTIGMIFSFCCNLWLNIGDFRGYIAVGVVDFAVLMLTAPMIIYGKRCRQFTKGMYYRFIEERDALK